MRRRVFGTVVVVLLVAANSALAGSKGFYVGAGLGRSTLDVTDIYPELFKNRGDSTNPGFKLFGGYRFLEYLGVEAGYTDLGSNETWWPSSVYLKSRVEVAANGWNVSAIGFLPVGTVDFMAKVGVIGMKSHVHEEWYEGEFDETVSNTELLLGLGVGFNLKHVVLRVEVERFEVAKAGEILMISGSFAYRF